MTDPGEEKNYRVWIVMAVIAGAASGFAFALASPMLVAGPLLLVMLPFALLIPSALRAYLIAASVLGALVGLGIGMMTRAWYWRAAGLIFLLAAPIAGYVVNAKLEGAAKAVIGGVMGGVREAAVQERKRLYEVEGYHRIALAELSRRADGSGWDLSMTIRGGRDADYAAIWEVSAVWESTPAIPQGYSGDSVPLRLGKDETKARIFLPYDRIKKDFLRREEEHRLAKQSPPQAFILEMRLEPDKHPYAYGIGNDIIETKRLDFPMPAEFLAKR